SGERAIANVPASQAAIVLVVGRIDDDPTLGGLEQPRKIGVEDLVFDEVIEHVERQTRLRTFASVFAGQPELLAAIIREKCAAPLDSGLADVESKIVSNPELGQLAAIAESEVDHGLDPALGEQAIEILGFVGLVAAIG